MSTDGFVRWEDLDLDYHLGQYTDEECAAPVDSSSDSDRENCPPPSKLPRTSAAKKTLYVCPICRKELKTIGGFRGHVSKQHNNPHLKACDHKKNPCPDLSKELDVQQSGPKPSVVPLDQVFCSAQHAALTALASRNYGKSRNGAAIAEAAGAASLKTHAMDPLASRMKELFHKDVLTQSERESLIARFHSVRSDVTLRDSILRSLDLPGSRQTLVLFYQSFLSKLLSSMLTGYVAAVKERATTGDFSHNLSDSDKETLYYVSGFITRKLGNQRGLCKELIKSFTTTNPSDVPSQWTTRLDRGGLQYATLGFYEFLVRCDKVLACAASKVSARCLLKDSTVEAVMETHAVKLQWDVLCTAAAVDTASSMATMESVVKAFFTVKGFSVAHRVRESIAHDLRQKKSLRHSLQKTQKY